MCKTDRPRNLIDCGDVDITANFVAEHKRRRHGNQRKCTDIIEINFQVLFFIFLFNFGDDGTL
jgi:hypothetical protein